MFYQKKKEKENFEAREKSLLIELEQLKNRIACLETEKAQWNDCQEKNCSERESLLQETEQLRNRCSQLQADNDRVYAGPRGMEEEINYLKYRISTLDELHESIVFGNWPHDGSFKNYTCRYPFERLEILPRGEVYTCCSGHIKHNYYIGNIYEDSTDFEGIWNSDKAKKLRYSVQEGNFEFCQKKCKFFHMPLDEDNPIRPKEITDETFSCKEWKDFGIKTTPKYIMLSCDESCNLRCPSCRSHIKALRKEESDKLFDRLTKIVRPMLKDCELLGALGTGEIFASSAISRFLKTISATEFPRLNLILTTNLQMADEAKWNEFSNLLDIPKTMRISMDGASKETYEKNRLGGVWERLQENLAYLCKLRKDPDAHVDHICLNFVVQDNNYHEMKAFTAMAEELGVDAVEFQKLTNWGTYSEQEFIGKDVLNSNHPCHEVVINTLKELLEPSSRKIEIIQNIL